MIAVAGGINCSLQKCYAIEDISGLKETWTKALVTLDSATHSFIKWAKLLQNCLSYISLLNQQRNTNLHQLKHISLGCSEHNSGPKGAAEWPMPTREMPNMTIYQFEKGFCRRHTFADVSCWVVPLCREILFGILCCSLCWFRCRLSHSLTWEHTAVAWWNSQALEECRWMKICLVPGDIGQANAQILQDRIGPGQNCLSIATVLGV